MKITDHLKNLTIALDEKNLTAATEIATRVISSAYIYALYTTKIEQQISRTTKSIAQREDELATLKEHYQQDVKEEIIKRNLSDNEMTDARNITIKRSVDIYKFHSALFELSIDDDVQSAIHYFKNDFEMQQLIDDSYIYTLKENIISSIKWSQNPKLPKDEDTLQAIIQSVLEKHANKTMIDKTTHL